MKADGTGQTRMTDDPGTDDQAAWSPDGMKIAFSAFRRDSLDIHVMNVDGTDQRNVTANSAGNSAPAWSPDGSKIAFIRGIYPWSFGYDLYVMNADGSGERALTEGGDIDYYPAWSPDSSRIAFVRNQLIQVMSAGGARRSHCPLRTSTARRPGRRTARGSLLRTRRRITLPAHPGHRQLHLHPHRRLRHPHRGRQSAAFRA